VKIVYGAECIMFAHEYVMVGLR